MAPRPFFVPDLTPEARPGLRAVDVRLAFVAESPHVSEIAPERVEDRRPLCGAAGKKWWRVLGEILEGKQDEDTGLERLIGLCRRHGFAVLNAVQYPLDPKITRRHPGADPLKILGFSKQAGKDSFRSKKASPEMKRALESLCRRLDHPALRGCPVVCLGNDAEWFVSAALGPSGRDARLRDKVPHPSAWWRKGGAFGRIARQKLEKILQR